MSGAKEDPAAKPAPAAAEAQPSKKTSSLVMTIGIFAGLAAAAFAIVLFVVRPLFPPMASGDVKPKPVAHKFGHVMALDSVVVNIAQTEGRRYLKATVHLEIPEEEKLVKELESRKPQMIDVIVSTLSKKTLTDVTAPEALDRLRGEMLERLTAVMGADRVRQVFVTEFVVQ